MSFFRDAIDTLQAYIPGQQPAPGTKIIKLNTNENPYSPSPAALAALKAFKGEELRRYPNPLGQEFREAAAEVLAIDPNWILPGNGSDDLLTMLVRAVAGPKRPVVYPKPTYVLYRTLAAIQEAPVVEVPFDDNFLLPSQALIEARGALTFVANPNSPSGTTASRDQLTALAQSLDGLLVIDEAYAAFADEDALDLVKHMDNVVILRTLSKSHALAGLRLGFAVARPSIIEGLIRVKDSYNLDSVATCVGAAAIRDVAYTQSVIERITASRAFLAEALENLGCRVLPSQANFLLVRPPRGDARRVYHHLTASGILVRYFDEPPLDEMLRISVGSDQEQMALLRTLRPILQSENSTS